MTTTPARADLPEAVKRLRRIRREGRASARDFHLLFDALWGYALPSSPLGKEVAKTPDLHVAFLLEGGETLACARIRRGRLSREPHTESAATRVILTPLVAERALTGHPAAVLGQAYFDGTARVEGKVRDLMGLLNLLEGLKSRLSGRP